MTFFRLTSVFLMVLVSLSTAYGQQSLFESSSGDTSIFLTGLSGTGSVAPLKGGSYAGVVLYNTSNSTLKLGYLHDITTQPYAWGFDVSGPLTDSSASIWQGNTGAPGVSIRTGSVWKLTHLDASKLDASSGNTYRCSTLCSQWLVAQLRYNHATFYTLPSSTPPFPSPVKRSFDGVEGHVGYNLLSKIGGADWLIGALLGIGRSNNTDSLTATKLTDNKITVIGTDQYILANASKNAFIGNYQEYLSVPLNVDVIAFPHSLRGMVGVDIFLRSNLSSTNRYGSPGAGVFISKAGEPARPLGGITAAYRDGKGQVSLVVGWTF